jgi:COMPASS component SWD2
LPCYQAFKTSKPDTSYVTSLDFDDQGDYLVAAGDDEIIQVFDVKEGKSTKSVPSKKYGVHLARFTHHSRQVLHASTKVDGMLHAKSAGLQGS